MHRNAHSIIQHAPGEEDALHNVKVLHQHISLRLGAEGADSVANAQLDGPLQCRGGGLDVENRVKNNSVKCGWRVAGENRKTDEEETPAFL